MGFKSSIQERRFVVVERTQSIASPEVKEWLESRGFSVSVADSVYEAMEWFSDYTLNAMPDCVVVNSDGGPLDNASPEALLSAGFADDVAILCLDADGPDRPDTAHDLGQLTSLLNSKCGRSAVARKV